MKYDTTTDTAHKLLDNDFDVLPRISYIGWILVVLRPSQPRVQQSPMKLLWASGRFRAASSGLGLAWLREKGGRPADSSGRVLRLPIPFLQMFPLLRGPSSQHLEELPTVIFITSSTDTIRLP